MLALDRLDEVLPRADYLLSATPDTPETRGLMDRRRLDLLKPSAGIINIGREAVMDYDALCDKLEEGSGGYTIEIAADDGRRQSVTAELGESINLGEIRLTG